MFADISSPRVRIGSRKWYTLPLSLAAHAIALVSIVFVTLYASDALPSPHDVVGAWIAPAPEPPSPPEPPAPRREPQQQQQPASNPNAAPVEAPSTIEPESGIVREPFEATTTGIGVIPGSPDVDTEVGPAPPPAPVKPREPVPVGGRVTPPTKLRGATPIYPTVAQIARVQDTVILQAVIDEEGRVRDLRVLRGHPLLEQAAIDAVRTWEYTPTKLNGQVVPVIMTVTVMFTLK